MIVFLILRIRKSSVHFHYSWNPRKRVSRKLHKLLRRWNGFPNLDTKMEKCWRIGRRKGKHNFLQLHKKKKSRVFLFQRKRGFESQTHAVMQKKHENQPDVPEIKTDRRTRVDKRYGPDKQDAQQHPDIMPTDRNMNNCVSYLLRSNDLGLRPILTHRSS